MLHLTTVDKNTYAILKKLNTLPFIKNNFALAGGTSLSLQIGHRMSIDLDFFSPQPFNIEDLKFALETFIGIDFKFISNNTRMLFCYINDIKCDFVHEPAKLINPFIKLDEVLYYTIEDIAAMKLQTICGRGKRKDFFDIFALLNIYSWAELVTFFEKKYSNSQFVILWRSIAYFEDAEQDFEITGISPYNKSWIDVKNTIQKNCI